jgi:hypothetical protein
MAGATAMNFSTQPTLTGRYITDREKKLEEDKLAAEQSRWQDQMNLYRTMLDQRTQQGGKVTDIANEYQRAFAEAKAANEAKYKESLGLVDKTSGQQAADVRSDYTKQRSSALQNLARSGMSGTTVGSTLSKGLGREETSALNRLADQLLQTKLGVMQNFKYEAPDTSIPTALIQTLGQNVSWPSF